MSRDVPKSLVARVDASESDNEKELDIPDVPKASAATPMSDSDSSEADQPPERRRCRRRRSRSRTVLAERRANPSSSASGDVDLTLYMSMHKIEKLSEDDKEKLRQVMRAHNAQPKFEGLLKKFSFSASGGVTVMGHIERYESNAAVTRQLGTFAEPIPTAQEFVEGIDHQNNNPVNLGTKWSVPRALQSNKMHYFTKFKREWLSTADAGLVFCEAWPKIQGDRVEQSPNHRWSKNRSVSSLHQIASSF